MFVDAQKARAQFLEEKSVFTRGEKLSQYIEEVKQIFLSSGDRVPYGKGHEVVNGVRFTYKSFSSMLPSEKSVDVVVSLGLPDRISHAYGEAWIRVEYFDANHRKTDEPRIKKEFVLAQDEVLVSLEQDDTRFGPLKTSSAHIDAELNYINEAIEFVMNHLHIERKPPKVS